MGMTKHLPTKRGHFPGYLSSFFSTINLTFRNIGNARCQLHSCRLLLLLRPFYPSIPARCLPRKKDECLLMLLPRCPIPNGSKVIPKPRVSCSQRRPLCFVETDPEWCARNVLGAPLLDEENGPRMRISPSECVEAYTVEIRCTS